MRTKTRGLRTRTLMSPVTYLLLYRTVPVLSYAYSKQYVRTWYIPSSQLDQHRNDIDKGPHPQQCTTASAVSLNQIKREGAHLSPVLEALEAEAEAAGLTEPTASTHRLAGDDTPCRLDKSEEASQQKIERG